jgi:hypothetical protein
MVKIQTPHQLAELLEKKHKVPMWRWSPVTPADKSNTSKKEYHFERPGMTSDEIATLKHGRGFKSLTSVHKNHPHAYLGISIYLKFVPDLFVIDFDTKEKCNEDNELYDFCRSLQSVQIDTKKGAHFYFYISNMPDFTCSTKLQSSEEYGDIDIVGRNKDGQFNVVERADTNVTEVDDGGYPTSVVEVPWQDLAPYFDLSRMMSEVKNKTEKSGNKKQRMHNNAIAGGEEHLDDTKFQGYLDRLDKVVRYHYEDWFRIGCICFNNWDDHDTGFSKWFAWTKLDPNFAEEHAHRTMGYCQDKWKTIGEAPNKVHWQTLRGMANIDDPSINPYQELYDVGGDNAVVNYMNEFLYFNRNTSEIIMIDPEDDTYLARFEVKKHTDLLLNFKKFGIFMEIGGKMKKVNPYELWSGHLHQKQVVRIIFDPCPNCPKNVFNIFRGFEIEKEDLKELSLPEANVRCQSLLDHLFIIWCKRNPIYYMYLMCWFAFIIQNPGIKIGILLVAKSKEGSGKGIVLDFMRHIMGGQLYAQINSIQQVINPKENAILEGKLLINCDEAHWGGNLKDANAMKGVITEQEVHIRDLYRKAYRVKNTTAFCFSSNEDRSTSAREGDRRHFGLELANTFSGKQTTKEHAQYFRNISGRKFSGISRDKAEGFAKILYDWDLSNFNPQDPPTTDFISEQIQRNWTLTQKWWYGVLSTRLLDIKSEHKQDTWKDGQREAYNIRQLEWGYILKDNSNGTKTTSIEYKETNIPLTITLGAISRCASGSSASLQNTWDNWCKNCGFDWEDTDPATLPMPLSLLHAQRILWGANGTWEMNHSLDLDEDIHAKRLMYRKPKDKKARMPRIKREEKDSVLWDKDYDEDNFFLTAHNSGWFERQDWQSGKWSGTGGPLSFPRIDHRAGKEFDGGFVGIEKTPYGQPTKYFVKDMDCLYDYLQFWGHDGVTADNFYDDLVTKNDFVIDRSYDNMPGDSDNPPPKRVMFYEQIHNVRRHYYDKSWLWDKYLQAPGLGYGASADNRDRDVFWMDIKTLMGGPKAEGGKYQSIRTTIDGCRRQLIAVPTIEDLRLEFCKWAGRQCSWDEDEEVQDPTMEELIGDQSVLPNSQSYGELS